MPAARTAATRETAADKATAMRRAIAAAAADERLGAQGADVGAQHDLPDDGAAAVSAGMVRQVAAGFGRAIDVVDAKIDEVLALLRGGQVDGPAPTTGEG